MRYFIENKIGKHRGVEFYVDDPRIADDECRDLIEGLKGDIQRGVGFDDGFEMRIGWMCDKFVAQPSGFLCLQEPDFIHMPARFTGSINRSLLHLRWQLTVAEAFGCANNFAFPSIAHAALVCNSYYTGNRIIMERFTPEASDSGWFIGCLQNDHDHNRPDHLHRESLYEIGLHRPEIAAFAILPESTRLVLERTDVVEAWHNNEKVLIEPDVRRMIRGFAE